MKILKSRSWSYLGANTYEWFTGGLVFCILLVCLPNRARAIPFLLITWIGIVLLLSYYRIVFRDKLIYRETLSTGTRLIRGVFIVMIILMFMGGLFFGFT